MNTIEYRTHLNSFVNEASKDLCANELIEGLLANLGSIVAINSIQAKTDPEVILEIVRHQLDVVVTGNLRYYNAQNRSSR